MREEGVQWMSNTLLLLSFFALEGGWGFDLGVLPSSQSPSKSRGSPTFQGCVSETAKKLPYCDLGLGVEERVQWLVDELSVAEMVGLLTCSDFKVNCNMPSSAIPRLGVPSYVWLTETNTGVFSRCLGEKQCASVFPNPSCMAASFNRTLWRAKGSVIGSEMRALNNWGGYINGSDGLKVGLTGFGPNINMIRDPRAGRNQETPSEDPFLSGSYAVEYVKGMQEEDKNGYPKMKAYLKHFAAYSREYFRKNQNNIVSKFDLFDSFLPQFEMAFKLGNASGVMCAYTGINGTSACSNGYLQDQVMRTDWGATNALSFSDCGAVSETSTGYPWNVETDAEAAAIAIMNGTDIEAGSNTFSSLSASISSGRVTLARLKEAASRTLRHRFHLGLFDPPTQVEWTSIPPSALGAPEHRKLTLEAALQGLVLLRNDGLLPLKKGIKIAVLGPHSFTRRNLFSDYYGLETCWSGGHENKNLNFSCIKTTCQAISEANEPNSEPKDGVSEAKTGGKTTCHDGVQFIGGDDGGLSQSISLGLEADVVILALGTVGQFSLDMEHEGFDKDSISLPGLQEQFAYEILKLNKPTALVLINGSPLAIDNLLPVASGSKLNNLGVRVPDAIIEAFYPGARGGEAIAKALFGEYNAWGKLPMTIYPASYAEEVSLEEYDITKYPGRTYRYYGGKVLFEFGFGLSLSKFNINCEQKVGISLEEHSYTCQVENLGPYDGEEVVQLYHKAPSDLVGHVYHPVPIKRLIDFQRVFVKSGQSVEVKFDINLSQQLRVTDANGKKRMYGGLHRLLFTNGVVQATELEVRVDVGHR